jgi:hypothetical protein
MQDGATSRLHNPRSSPPQQPLLPRQGDERQHSELRCRVVAFMAAHEEFAPFVEDDEAFASYAARMRKASAAATCGPARAASRHAARSTLT